MKIFSKNKNKFLFLVLIILIIVTILFSAANHKRNVILQEAENKKIELQNIITSVPVEAKAVSIYDLTDNRKIYGKNDTLAMPLASLTKTMTIIVVLNNHNSDDIVSLSSEAIKQNGDAGFKSDEKWKVGDLAKATLVGSLNDGAYSLAENVPNFLYKMREEASLIGMKNAIFMNPAGLDLDVGNNKAGAYATAEGANQMAIFAFKTYPEIFGATILPELNLKSESGFTHDIKNTNIIIGQIPNLLFSKTGFTDLAGGNLTIVFKNKNDHKIAITVLGSTLAGRFSDMQKLINVL